MTLCLNISVSSHGYVRFERSVVYYYGYTHLTQKPFALTVTKVPTQICILFQAWMKNTIYDLFGDPWLGVALAKLQDDSVRQEDFLAHQKPRCALE
jgi:hypothetical protein